MPDQQHKNTKKIWMDSPRDRYMDMSPTRLAQELGIATNTVRNKLDALNDVDFCIQNDGNYLLYNHECLPILKAYIGKHEDRHREIDTTEFFRRISAELDKDPMQKVCKTFLYNQPLFRKYTLQTKLESPIQQRLNCIQNLAEKLDLNPTEEDMSPFQVQSTMQAIISLDRLIYDLANLIPEEPQKKGNTLLNVKDLTEQWCKELVALRNRLVKNSQIFYDSSNTNALSALEDLLLHRLAPSALSVAEKMAMLSAELDQQQAFTQPMDEMQCAELTANVRSALLFDMENYLNALFTFDTIPGIEMPKGVLFAPLVSTLIENSCDLLRYAMENIENRFVAMHLWTVLLKFGVGQIPSPKECLGVLSTEVKKLVSFVTGIEESLKNLWDAIRKLDGPKTEQIADYVGMAVIAQRNFSLDVQNNDVTNYLEMLLGKQSFCSRHIDTILAAAAVTIECYWRRHADAYTEHVVARCQEYQKAMNES